MLDARRAARVCDAAGYRLAGGETHVPRSTFRGASECTSDVPTVYLGSV